MNKWPSPCVIFGYNGHSLKIALELMTRIAVDAERMVDLAASISKISRLLDKSK